MCYLIKKSGSRENETEWQLKRAGGSNKGSSPQDRKRSCVFHRQKENNQQRDMLWHEGQDNYRDKVLEETGREWG